MVKNGTRPKLPAKQLAILAVARFAEPLAMTSVFPYLPEMIASFGVKEKDVAGWAGVTSAAFSLAQSVTAVPWGRASDNFGRKPVIMTGLFCTMICFIVWGMSSSLTMAIAVRAIQGGSNGNVGIIRTMVAEMVPEKELQPIAFSIMPLVWSLGSIVGPAFGGFFAQPAKQFPGLFGNSAFLNKYPFALPNILGAAFFLISITTGILFLKETLETKRNSRDWGLVLGERLTEPFKRNQRRARHRRYSFQDDEASAPLLPHHPRLRDDQNDSDDGELSRPAGRAEKPAPPSMASVFTRQSVINLIAYTFLALHSVAYDQVLPVFLHYPREPDSGASPLPPSSPLPGSDIDSAALGAASFSPVFFSGGFGLSSGSIGTIFTLYGIVCGVVQFVVFPPLCARFGVLNCLKACALTFPIVYLLTPFTTLVQSDSLRFAALMIIMVVKAFTVIFGFPCTTILLTNSAASVRVLGTLNGFATTFSALGRATGPALTGAAFTWGVHHGIISVPWWLLAGFAAVGAVPVWWIVEGSGPSTASDDEDEENGDYFEDDADERYKDDEMDQAIIAGDAEDIAAAPEDDLLLPDDADDDDDEAPNSGENHGSVGLGSFSKH